MLNDKKIIVDTVENYNFLIGLGNRLGEASDVFSHIELSESIKSYKKLASCDVCKIIILPHYCGSTISIDGVRHCKECYLKRTCDPEDLQYCLRCGVVVTEENQSKLWADPCCVRCNKRMRDDMKYVE
ncbi:hypothetical protein [Bacillus wiedmannii]|uniref:hypothetical protein n=1 Tax=Bacillus wiedmannii TaxID=1890302 RepID=UPI000BF49040|nr:hypothetical protein [Bacillus wiedmannii]PGA30318.1 hypothetical protein COL74_25660 [Bacillus wiedmannii]